MRRAGYSLIACLAVALVACSPREALTAAWANVARQPSGAQQFLRYLYLDHVPVGERKQLWQVLAAHVNGISLKRDIARPVVILTDARGQLAEADGLAMKEEDWSRAILLRLNLFFYGWNKETYELLAKVDPHFHFQVPDTTGKLSVVEAEPLVKEAEVVLVFREDSFQEAKLAEVKEGDTYYVRGADSVLVKKVKVAVAVGTRFSVSDDKRKFVAKTLRAPWLNQEQLALLEAATQSAVPLLMADFFWWQTSIQAERAPGPGYYDFLGIKDEKTFQEVIGVDRVLFKKKFAEFVKEHRAAVARSGISRQARRILVEDKLGGEYWVTLDNRVARGSGNPLDTPDDRFTFDASEQMGHLPNGLLAQGLFDNKGVRQDVAPDLVGPDHTSTGNDGRVHAGQCMRCHEDGLKSFKDWMKNVYRPPFSVEGPDAQKIIDLQNQYFERIEDKLAPSRERHARALFKASGLTMKEHSQGIRRQWNIYQDNRRQSVSLERAAREFGCRPADLTAAIQGLKTRQPGKTSPLFGLRTYDVWGDQPKVTIPLDNYLEVAGELQNLLLGAKK